MQSYKKGDNSGLKAAALDYISRNYPVFPLRPLGKQPILDGGFHNASLDPKTVSLHWDNHPNANIGMPTGAVSGVFVLDIDKKNGIDGHETLAELETQYGTLPPTRRTLTANGGVHYWFRYPNQAIKSRAAVAKGIDVRGDAGYVVVPPSRLEGDKLYQWDDPTATIVDAPEWLINLLTKKAKSIPQAFTADGNIIPNGQRNSFLTQMAGSLRKYGVGPEQVLDFLWETNANRCNPPLQESEVLRIADSASRWQAGSLEFPTTDAGNAELFAHLNRGQLVYDHRMGRWLEWQGHWWAKDTTGVVVGRAIRGARERQQFALKTSENGKSSEQFKFGVKSENRSRIDACLELAKSIPGIADSGNGWDSDPWLLGVVNGIVDLRTGELRDGKPEDHISLHADVAFDPHATSARWEKFMREIFLDDLKLISYIQRAIGYSLTGITREHIMFVASGEGANGKSVMLRLLTALLGGYAKVTVAATLDAAYKSTISNDVAALVNQRLVWASETEKTSTLNEAKIKQLVHADEVTARFLYHENFTFTPVAKFWLTVNDLPTVRDNSHGMWRSIHVIPFKARFEGADDNKELTEELRREMPGILNWAIKGCLDWQANKLSPPEHVTAATENYRSENDSLAEFLVAACESVDDKEEIASALYRRYSEWAENTGLTGRDKLSFKEFGSQMKAKFRSKKTNKGCFYYGIAILQQYSG